MIALPWYLLAVSILLVVIGSIWAGVAQPRRAKPITRKMSDADIVRTLNREERLPPSSLVILLGFIGIGISLVWRLALRFF